MVEPAGSRWTPGLLHAAGDRIGAQALAAVLLGGVENLGALADDAGDPVEGLDVVHERRAVEDADLGDDRAGGCGGMPRLPSIDSIIADSSPQM